MIIVRIRVNGDEQTTKWIFTAAPSAGPSYFRRICEIRSEPNVSDHNHRSFLVPRLHTTLLGHSLSLSLSSATETFGHQSFRVYPHNRDGGGGDSARIALGISKSFDANLLPGPPTIVDVLPALKLYDASSHMEFHFSRKIIRLLLFVGYEIHCDIIIFDDSKRYL